MMVLTIDVATAAMAAFRAVVPPWEARIAAAAVVLALDTVPPRMLTSRSPEVPRKRFARCRAVLKSRIKHEYGNFRHLNRKPNPFRLALNRERYVRFRRLHCWPWPCWVHSLVRLSSCANKLIKGSRVEASP